MEGTMKPKTSKKSIKFVSQANRRPVEVRRIGRFKTITRFADVTVFDKLFYEEKIDYHQHQISEWLYAIGLSSGIRFSGSSVFEKPIGSSFSNTSETEKSSHNRLLLHKCMMAVQKGISKEACSLLEAIIFYDKSIREWSKSTGYGRNGKVQLLRQSLDAVIDFRDNGLKY